MFNRIMSLSAGLSLLPLLLACGAVGGDDGGSGPQVVAAFYPYAFVAERVVGEHADVTNLTAPGVEPHDLELTPQQVAQISEADLLIYERGFQPSIDEAVDQNPPAASLDITEVVELQDTGTPADDHDEHEGGGEGIPEGDPHIWQDPTLLIPITERFAAEMADVDPGHAADYRARADALVADLEELDKEFATGLADCERTAFVTSHAAFGYLARAYGLTMVPVAGLSPDVEPSPAQLAEVQDFIEANGITTVFSEALGSRRYAATLATDLGVETAVLDPIEGLSDEGSGDDYISLMRDNLAALEEANGCS